MCTRTLNCAESSRRLGTCAAVWLSHVYYERECGKCIFENKNELFVDETFFVSDNRCSESEKGGLGFFLEILAVESTKKCFISFYLFVFILIYKACITEKAEHRPFLFC